MNKYLKIIALVTSILFFVTACNSSSSDDAKKVVVKKVVAKSEETLAKVDTKPLKAQASQFVEGKHYFEIFPAMQTDSAQGKVEVIEMMWLGCPHCLEPTMLKYKVNHPDFVEFKQVPAMLNPSWSADATTFYIAEMLDPTGEKGLITKVFQAIHEQKRRLSGASSVKRFFTQLGFTSEQVDNAQNSMAFRVKIKRAQEISASSQAQSVPTIIINGKYRTSPYTAGSEAKLMQIIDMLTRKEKNQ